ncbi:hypothetical protein VNO80_02332 [Phaseolus coccineus]|uniref:Uncharacterized protein n=1 Tax=Phaseolus coccineus TaxID=3886 RepID=A0AAN9NWH9_PHACN
MPTVEWGDGINIRSSLRSVAHQWHNHHASCDCGARGQRLPDFFFVFTAGRNLLQPGHAGVDYWPMMGRHVSLYENASCSATLLSILRYVAALHACPYQRIFSSLSLRVLSVNY